MLILGARNQRCQLQAQNAYESLTASKNVSKDASLDMAQLPTRIIRALQASRKRSSMGNKAIISRDQIIDTAYHMAMKHGLGVLNIRAVAAECGISVGTMYHSFATKSELINSVVGKFWQESLADIMREADDTNVYFISFCRHLSQRMHEAFSQFREGFLIYLSTLHSQEMELAHEREERAFIHMRKGLEHALAADEAVDRSRLVGALNPQALCDLIWNTLLQSAHTGYPIDETLFCLLEEVLY